MSCDEGIFTLITRGHAVAGVPYYPGYLDNKPPVVYLLYGSVLHLFGPGIWKVRLLFAACVFSPPG